MKLQQYVNHELPDVQAGFRIGRGTRDQIANIRWIIKKARELQKNIAFASLTMPKPLTVWITTNWKILQEMGIPDNLTCLLRNQYAGQESTFRAGHVTTDCFQIGKGVHQGCILSPCLCKLYAEYIMRNAGLDEAQAGIKIAGRNINNSRYADNTTLMAESEEELKSLLMKIKEESEEVGLKLNIQKTEIMASSPITIEGGKVEAVTDFIFLGFKITADNDCSHEIKRHLLLGRKAMTDLVQFNSVAQSCPTLCDPMNHSTPGLPVHHQLPEFTQTHVQQAGDDIQPFHPLSSTFTPAFNLSQHQGLFQ